MTPIVHPGVPGCGVEREVGNMQFMSIFTWEPGKTGEVMETRAAEKSPEGMIVINEWIDLGSNTVFRLIETDDPVALLKAGHPWNDLGYKEMHPVMEAKEALERLKG
ncbi:DUF3303 domain-containing protein [Methanoculleus sp. 7T]|uniref:DUF3303 domain-containing protein n=1 Tax=Methanoculleus sp. 7T TaxID=2937282 RepID=UPI0020C129C9|nr:DUF3303 family protein [Methanoculleus sp. 7T]MCK8518144.1 DUF3303 domain-containing protein [Methanoculleus sp. 7T]